MKKVYKTSVAEITQLKDNFFRIEYARDTFVDLPELEEALAIYKEVLGNEKFYLLTVINRGVTVSERARNYWTTPGRSKIKIAEAFVINRLSHVLITNFVTKFQPPSHEIKFFKTEKKAMEWLYSKKK